MNRYGLAHNLHLKRRHERCKRDGIWGGYWFSEWFWHLGRDKLTGRDCLTIGLFHAGRSRLERHHRFSRHFNFSGCFREYRFGVYNRGCGNSLDRLSLDLKCRLLDNNLDYLLLPICRRRCIRYRRRTFFDKSLIGNLDCDWFKLGNRFWLGYVYTFNRFRLHLLLHERDCGSLRSLDGSLSLDCARRAQ